VLYIPNISAPQTMLSKVYSTLIELHREPHFIAMFRRDDLFFTPNIQCLTPQVLPLGYQGLTWDISSRGQSPIGFGRETSNDSIMSVDMNHPLVPLLHIMAQ
jgi:hypothetical protein